jgi:hypothetical protein
MIRAIAMVLAMAGSFATAADEKKKAETVTGLVTGVDVMARKIFITVKGKETEYEVKKDAKITVNGAAGKKLEDVRLKLTATLTLDGKQVVKEIVAEKKKK